MISKALAFEIFRRVKTDLVIGSDNAADNIIKTSDWSFYTKAKTRGTLKWFKDPISPEKWEPDFIDHMVGYNIYDDKAVANDLVAIYQAKSGRCYEHVLLTLFYWLLYTVDCEDVTFSIVKFKTPFNHVFLIVISQTGYYICDSWLNFHEYIVQGTTIDNAIFKMGEILCDNLIGCFNYFRHDPRWQNIFYQQIVKTRKILNKQSIPKIKVMRELNTIAEREKLLGAMIFAFSENGININHPTFYRLKIKYFACGQN